MGSIGGGKSKQQATAQQGIRGTSLEAPVLAGMNRSFAKTEALANKAADSPFGFFRGQRVGANTGSPNDIAPTGRYGASAAVDTGLSGVMNDMFSKISSGSARRGQYSPENSGGIVGSAGAEWAKYASPMIQQWQQYTTELPSKLWSDIIGFAGTPFQQGTNVLGGQSQSSAKSSNFGVSVAGDSPSMQKSTGGCWIAEALYGPLAVDTWLLRMYLTTEKAHTWYMALYRKWGRTVAKWVEQSALLRMILKPLFDRGVKAARGYYGR